MDQFDANDARAALEKQIADLKNEIGDLSAKIREQAKQARSAARDYADDASDQAQGAVRQVRQQAGAVVDTIRENPGTAATVLSGAGVLGFMLGICVGMMLSDPPRDRWYRP